MFARVLWWALLMFEAVGVYGAPSLDECPPDSENIGGTCICNEDFCIKPPCLATLSIRINGTNVPGNCCPVYTCIGCPGENMIEGQCPCAEGAVLNEQNQCKCIDKEKSLKEFRCVCDTSKCALPGLCDRKSVLVTENTNNSCCPNYKCIRCPDDSFAMVYNSDDIEDKCVCYPCKNKCGPNQIITIIHPGKNIPNACCDLYICKDPVQPIIPSSCQDGNQTYSDGEIWYMPEEQKCQCQNGIALCDQKLRNCQYDGKLIENGESYMQDICTKCTCYDGSTKCIAHMCQIALETNCPSLETCNKKCSYGFAVSKTGCEICKCNNASGILEDILSKYNITYDDLIRILNDYSRRLSTSSKPRIEQVTKPSLDQPYSTETNSKGTDCFPSMIIYITVGIFFILAVPTAFLVWYCCRPKNSFDVISPYNENNNLAKKYDKEKVRLCNAKEIIR